ncbi:MAG: Copper chaperone CopZ [Firmicutes bacterium ADurb.Bin373]|nr:MAG: Copper chaperone CopZ [Firmicutes bacterium ADurb.Bin373]
MDKIILHVDGMSCAHCKAAVENALKKLDGILGAEVDIAAKTVTVTYDAVKAGRDDITGAITDAGYEVKD